MARIKLKKISVSVALLFSLLVIPCSAQSDMQELYDQQWESSGAQTLTESLPEQTREWLNEFGGEGGQLPNAETVASGIWSLFVDTSKTPLATGVVLVGSVLLCALVNGMGDTVGASSPLFGTVGVLVSCTTVVTPLVACVGRVLSAIESADVFTASFVPVYAGVLATSGNVASAATFQSAVLLASNGMATALTVWIVPLSIAVFALGLIGAVTDGQLQLHRIGSFWQKSVVWILGVLMTLFVGLLSMQQLTSVATDTLGDRMLKFSIAGFIPMVGGSLSETVGTVKGCLGVLKGTVGAFGVLADVAIVLPPLLECVWWQIWLGCARAVADLFGVTSVSAVLKACGDLLKTLIAVLACLALLIVLSVTVVSKGGG